MYAEYVLPQRPLFAIFWAVWKGGREGGVEYKTLSGVNNIYLQVLLPAANSNPQNISQIALILLRKDVAYEFLH